MTEAAAMRELRALNARFIHNFVTNDVPSHDAIIHRDFVHISTEGERRRREDYLRRWASGFDPDVIIYWDCRDEHISLFGDMALVWSVNRHVVIDQGREVTGMTGYTDTYVREGGAWKCIQAQITPVAPDQEPGDDTVISIYINGVRAK